MEHRALTKTLAEQRSKARIKAVTELPWPRCGNLAVGVWLQASAVLWPRSDASRVSAWLPGLLISIIALLAMGAPPMRWLNVFLGLWLVLWTMASTSTEPLAYANGILCGLLVVTLAWIPSKTAAEDYRE